MLQNQAVHALREGWPVPRGIDPYSSAAKDGPGLRMVVDPLWWMLRVGVAQAAPFAHAA